MTRISELPLQTSALTSSAEIPVSPAGQSGATYRASLGQLLTFMEANFASPDFVTVTAAPTSSGYTISLASSTNSIRLIISPTGTFAAGTITLPALADCFDGQQIVVTSSLALTTLTVAGNGATVAGAPAGLGVNGFFALRFSSSSSTWYCVAQSLGATSTFSTITVTDPTNSIKDINGNTVLSLSAGDVAAVNHVMVVNRETTSSPQVSVAGADANIGLTLVAKGTGTVKVGNDVVATITGVQTISNKTMGTSNSYSGGTFILPTISPVGTIAAVEAQATALGGAVTGMRGMVSNANSTTFNADAIAGGANVVPVFYNGSVWKIG